MDTNYGGEINNIFARQSFENYIMNYYSNIYWHFTGSPKDLDWTKVFCPNDILINGNTPKTECECIKILQQIIVGKVLLAKCREKIDDHIITEPFCCVTDIPIQNLEEHTRYYGRVAIGFKYEKIHQDFNPVLYIPKKDLPTRNKTETDRLESWKKHAPMFGGSSLYKNPQLIALLAMGQRVDENQLGSFIINHFKITTFSKDPAFSFYREREWRKIRNFNFEFEDIAAIIVSEEQLSNTQNIISQLAKINIPILTWELLNKM